MKIQQNSRFYMIALLLSLLANSSAAMKTPFNEKPGHWDKFQPELQTLILGLSTAPPTPAPQVNAAIGIHTLPIPENRSIVDSDGQVISIFELIIYGEDYKKVTDSEALIRGSKSRTILTYTDGRKKLFMPPASTEQIITLAGKIQSHGGIYDFGYYIENAHKKLTPLTRNEFCHCKLFDAVDFNTKQPVMTEEFYTDKETDYYRWHRPLMAEILVATLSEHSGILGQARKSGAYLFCLGCGSGDDIHACHQALAGLGIQPVSCGIENNSKLTACAINKYPKYNFIQGDARFPAKLIQQFKSDLKPTLVVAEGFLNRRVLPGYAVALRVLQELIQENQADLVIIGGMYNLLVNQRTISQAGWKAEHTMLKHPHPEKLYSTVFALHKPSPTEHIANIKAISLRRSRSGTFTTLDLSMSGLPITSLKYFIEKGVIEKGEEETAIKTVTQVDLSYSYLMEGQILKAIHLLLGFPNLKHVMVSGHELWYESFRKEMERLGKLRLIRREDNQYPEELPSFPPDLARLFGQKMPYSPVYVPRKKQPTEVTDPKPVSPVWHGDITASYLSDPSSLQAYHTQLANILTEHQLRLQTVLGNGECCLNAMAPQLGIEPAELASIMVNQLTVLQDEISNLFPHITGQNLNEIIDGLITGGWGDFSYAQLVAHIFDRRVILVHFNSQSGAVQFLVFNHDGTTANLPTCLKILTTTIYS